MHQPFSSPLEAAKTSVPWGPRLPDGGEDVRNAGLPGQDCALSSIILPWTDKDPRVLSGYRAKAIRLLIGSGAALAAIGLVVFVASGLASAERITDWRILAAWIGAVGPVGTGLFLIAGGLAVVFYRQIGALLKTPWVAFAILCGAAVGTALVVWAHAWLFEFAAGLRTGKTGTSIAGGLSAQQVYEGIRDAAPVPLLAYLLWPLQYEIVRDVIAMGAVVGFINVVAAFGIWWERKVAARMQSRLGPMRVGGWHGWAQSPADGIKLVLKEDLIPQDGDPILFRLAPYLVFIPPVAAFLALPFAGAYVFRDMDVALLFILAMMGIDVIGVIIAGWASNNKWSVYGAMREACQMVSYEIPMGMSLLIPVMMAGSLQLSKIAEAQAGGFASWFVFANPWCFVAFFTYCIGALASCKRTPFDLPESESELVAGFLTEYSGFRWALFFFGEYTAIYAVSGVAAILFLGGWNSPLPAGWAPEGGGFVNTLIRGLFFDGPILFILKATFLFWVQMWLRWTLPRIRIDQVLYACVQVLLPLTMVLLLANTLWVLGVEQYEIGWLVGIDQVLHWALVAIGLAAVAGMIGIAVYGFINRRRLVGRLVIEHLPGA